MTAVSSPFHHFMASPSSSAFPSTSSSFPSSSATSSAPMGYAPSAAVDDDDLLALLGSDTFSLESARDRDLGLLQSFLQGVLPGSQANHPTPPQHPGLAYGQSGGAGAGWNGWRPSNSGAGADGAAAPYGSPMSFTSTAGAPSAPSSSFTSAHFPSPAQQAFLNLAPSPSSPFARDSHAQLAPSPRRGSLSSRGRAPHTAGQAMQVGCRAPAVSRERVPTSMPAPPLASGAQREGAEDYGWKSRLRSARPAPPPAEDDTMME